MSRPLLLTEKCSTCVFRPGNLMHLKPGRLADLVRSNLDAGSLLTCHSTLYRDDVREASCRGFADAYGPQTNLYRIVERLGGFDEIPPPDPLQ